MMTRRQALTFIGLAATGFTRGVIAAPFQKREKPATDTTVTLEVSGMT